MSAKPPIISKSEKLTSYLDDRDKQLTSAAIMLNSEKLTSDLSDREKLIVRATLSRARIVRLTKLVFPEQFIGTTVLNTVEKVLVTKAAIRREPLLQDTVRVTNIDKDESARNDDIIKRTLAGEPLAQTVSNQELLAQEHRQLSAIENAIVFLDKEIYKERAALAIQLRKTQKAADDANMKSLFAALAEVLPSFAKASEHRRQFIDNGIPPGDIGSMIPAIEEVLGNSRNPHSPLAELFREAHRRGFIATVPESYVL